MINNILTETFKEQAKKFQDPLQHVSKAMVSSLERVTDFSLTTARNYAGLGIQQLQALSAIKDAESFSEFQHSQSQVLTQLNQMILKDVERLTELGAQLRNDLTEIATEVTQTVHSAATPTETPVKPADKTKATVAKV